MQNAFESWLHPDRYKTTLCSYAGACTRKFCFFAHSAAELRQPASKQHSAAAAAGNPELRLTKTASLDTNPSIGTPNSSSSNMSSSSAQAMHGGWGAGSPMAVSVGNSAAAAAAAAAGMYVQQLQPMAGTAVGIPVNSSLTGGAMYLPMYQTPSQQQQQLMTAFIDSSNSSSLLANPPGLSTIVMTAPQLAAAGNAAAAAAAPMQVGGGFTSNAAGMQLSWDNLALARLASLGTPMATDSSTLSSNSLLFDPTSPSTPLTVGSNVSPVHSPMLGLPNTVNGGLQLGSLQHALDGSSQQQQNGQLRQQLLQHLMNVQQQKQPQQQQQQDAQIDVGSNWSLSSVDANIAMMLSLNQQPVQQSNLSAMQALQQFPLQQQQQDAFSGMDVQVLPGPQGFLPVVQGSAGQQDLACGLTDVTAAATAAAAPAADSAGIGGGSSSSSGTGFASAGPAATQQLQQQLNLLSFAMA
jgi:hypothetical protein